jgi:hypothetical protein
MTLETGLPIILAMAVLWFGTRMMMGKKMGGVSLGSMFQREKPLVKSGLGEAAIKTLLDDVKTFAHEERAVRGLILAGPFAEAAAAPEDEVTFVILVDNLQDYRETLWRARWPYPARGHLIRDHQIEAVEGAILHRLALRGAPPLAFHFVDASLAKAPSATAKALNRGAKPIETGTDAARPTLQRWQDYI